MQTNFIDKDGFILSSASESSSKKSKILSFGEILRPLFHGAWLVYIYAIKRQQNDFQCTANGRA